jgi:hypothetical protein
LHTSLCCRDKKKAEEKAKKDEAAREQLEAEYAK